MDNHKHMDIHHSHSLIHIILINITLLYYIKKIFEDNFENENILLLNFYLKKNTKQNKSVNYKAKVVIY